ncbi:hypothetical protein LguiA_003407 [Lonicera macranthoides]
MFPITRFHKSNSRLRNQLAMELVFIPAPGVGHLISAVEMANLLITRDQRLSITFLIITLPSHTAATAYSRSLHRKSNNSPRLHFIDLPAVDSTPILNSTSPVSAMSTFIDNHALHVRDAVARLATRPGESARLAGFVVDMLCTAMIDVANEFGVPTYVFLTSGAAFLGFNFSLLNLSDSQDVTELIGSVTDLSIPSFENSVPAKLIPLLATDKEGGSAMVLSLNRRLKRMNGILVNTFFKLESHALKSLVNGGNPPIYPVGPVLSINNNSQDHVMITRWLDHQPPLSVVFLCFGSMGSFDEDQVKEIAYALERSGHRFPWSLRRPSPNKGKLESPTEYSNPAEVLPEGFLERTASVGMVTGWVPQAEVLSHWAVGGFVSHCGWNSILESLWYGVPLATWPMYAEQQVNAFEMVVELKLGVEIKIDYRKEFFGEKNTSEVVKAEEIEIGIRKVMESESEQRKKVKEMKDKCRMAMMEGGSSYNSLGRFIDNISQLI